MAFKRSAVRSRLSPPNGNGRSQMAATLLHCNKQKTIDDKTGGFLSQRNPQSLLCTTLTLLVVLPLPALNQW